MTIKLKHYEGPCELLRCFEDGPHAHPICPECGALNYRISNGLVHEYDARGSCWHCETFATLHSKGLQGDLTVEEAATLLHMLGVTDRIVHRNTILSWIASGILPNVKVAARGQGGSYRFALSDLTVLEPPTKGGRGGRPKKKGGDD
jgi:hypothetical protein